MTGPEGGGQCTASPAGRAVAAIVATLAELEKTDYGVGMRGSTV
jgi:hypothetical protein